jgi:hypothetical protein
VAWIAKRHGGYTQNFYNTCGKRIWITTPKGTTKIKAEEKLRGDKINIDAAIFTGSRIEKGDMVKAITP